MESVRWINKIEVLFLFHDNNRPQTDDRHLMVLVDESGTIPCKILTSGPLDKQLSLLYNEFIRVDFSWPTKYIDRCYVDEDTLVINYICKMPLINNINKKGTLITFNDFLEKNGKYYESGII